MKRTPQKPTAPKQQRELTVSVSAGWSFSRSQHRLTADGFFVQQHNYEANHHSSTAYFVHAVREMDIAPGVDCSNTAPTANQ